MVAFLRMLYLNGLIQIAKFSRQQGCQPATYDIFTTTFAPESTADI